MAKQRRATTFNARPNLGRNIRMLREAVSWSQEQLATIARVNVRTIQRAESGAPLDVENVRAIAAAFDVPFEGLTNFDMDSTVAALDEFKRTHTVVHVAVVQNAAEFSRHVAGIALLFSLAAPGTLEQEAAAAVLNEGLQDLCDLWNDLGPVARLEASAGLQSNLDALRALGLVVAVGTQKMKVGPPPYQLEGDVTVCIVSDAARPTTAACYRNDTQWRCA